MKRALAILFVLFALHSVHAQKEHENLQISLLTMDPRPDHVYTIFGHTALRLCDPSQKLDIVFNWGTFDFENPNFIYQFIKGETDYFLSTEEYSYFIYVSTLRNSVVTEQILNIPDDRKVALIAMLQNNLLPENQEYRYNFIFENCTSRVRDIIENFCGGKLHYPDDSQQTSFRKLIHEYTNPYPWTEVGIDCVIGSGADSLVSVRNELWLPKKLEEKLNESYVVREDGSTYPIVLSSKIILHSNSEQTSPSIRNWPLITGFILLIICIGIVFASYRTKRRYRAIPVALFFLAGIGGCIVTITCFISIHPCTWPNWNIVWLHPLHFIGFVGFFFKRTNGWITWYHRLNFVLLAIFLLGWSFIPQNLNLAFILYILCLMLVSGFQLLAIKKKIYE